MKQPRANKKVSAIMNEVEWAGGDIIVLITKKVKIEISACGAKGCAYRSSPLAKRAAHARLVCYCARCVIQSWDSCKG